MELVHNGPFKCQELQLMNGVTLLGCTQFSACIGHGSKSARMLLIQNDTKSIQTGVHMQFIRLVGSAKASTGAWVRQ